MFRKLEQENRIAFIPFTLIGDPDQEISKLAVETLARHADALELGIPFSDPVADGPIIQAAGVRARQNGIKLRDSLDFLKDIRRKFPDCPIGILVYVNLIYKPGLDFFYKSMAECEVDSVLIADVPLQEASPFRTTAKKYGIQQVFIAPPNASDDKLKKISQASEGYTYVVTRTGVTGTDQQMGSSNRNTLNSLRSFGSAPPVLGFGISNPKHVQKAAEMGAQGAISGSAVVSIIEKHRNTPNTMVRELTQFIKSMKKAANKPT
jgi:tryptophan synthase alpha chain